MEYREELEAIKKQIVKVQRELRAEPFASLEDLKNGFGVMISYKDTLQSLYGSYVMERCFEDLENSLEDEDFIHGADLDYLIKYCRAQLTAKIKQLKIFRGNSHTAELVATNRD